MPLIVGVAVVGALIAGAMLSDNGKTNKGGSGAPTAQVSSSVWL